jgi:hypothetical protein
MKENKYRSSIYAAIATKGKGTEGREKNLEGGCARVVLK